MTAESYLYLPTWAKYKEKKKPASNYTETKIPCNKKMHICEFSQ